MVNASFDPTKPLGSFTALIDAGLFAAGDAIMLRALTEAGAWVQAFGTIALVLVALGISRGLTGASAAGYGAMVLKIGFVVAILSAGSYTYWVRDAVLIAIPASISNLVGAGSNVTGAGAYDLLLRQAFVFGLTIWRDLSMLNPLKLLVGLFWIIAGAAIVCGYGIWLLGHFMAVVYVSLGGIFLALALFAPTRGITAAWLGATLSAVVLQALSVMLSTLLVAAQTGILSVAVGNTGNDPYTRIGVLFGAAVIFGLCGWFAKRLPDVASRLCGGIHFSPDRVVSATYGAVASGAKTGGRAALNFGSGQYRALQQAVERRRPVSPASLTPPASTLSRTPAAGAS